MRARRQLRLSRTERRRQPRRLVTGHGWTGLDRFCPEPTGRCPPRMVSDGSWPDRWQPKRANGQGRMPARKPRRRPSSSQPGGAGASAYLREYAPRTRRSDCVRLPSARRSRCGQVPRLRGTHWYLEMQRDRRSSSPTLAAPKATKRVRRRGPLHDQVTAAAKQPGWPAMTQDAAPVLAGSPRDDPSPPEEWRGRQRHSGRRTGRGRTVAVPVTRRRPRSRSGRPRLWPRHGPERRSCGRWRPRPTPSR